MKRIPIALASIGSRGITIFSIMFCGSPRLPC